MLTLSSLVCNCKWNVCFPNVCNGRTDPPLFTQDDSPSVRLESINFLGAFIRNSKELAVTYFDILAATLKDSSIAVRKTALKIIWEACVIAKDSPKTVEACHLILTRSHDTGDASQDVAVKFVHTLWFSPTTDAGTSNSQDHVSYCSLVCCLR